MVCQSFVTQHRGTKKTMGLLYLILSLLLNDKVHSAFEVTMSQNPLSWERALHHCNTIRSNLTFAVPDVNLSSMTVLDKIDLQGEAWVGYYQTYEHFLFIVCVPLSALESFVSATFNIRRQNNRPGMCYSLCGLQGYIGLQAGLCYCIETTTFSIPDIHRVNSSCEKLLHCDNGMHCGNDESKKISVYKKVTISSTSSNDIRENSSGCITVTREYKMSLADCVKDHYKHLCESYTGRNLNLVESRKQDQWVYSIKDCTQDGMNPTTFTGNGTNFIFPNISASWWTSVVQDLVIRNCSGCMTMKGTPLYEGFLRNSTEGIKLEFAQADEDSRKTFVACMTEQPSNEQENRTNEPTEIPKTSVTSEESTMSGIPEQPSNEQENRTNEPTEIPKSSVISEASTMSGIPEQPSNEQENRANEPTEIPKTSITSEASTMSRIPVLMVILPIGLAALALITVVTLIAVFWRRSKEKAATNVELSKQKTTKTVVPHNSERQQVYYEHKKETLNQLDENDQGHVSSEYDSLKDYNAHVSAPTGNLYDTSNFNIGEETYAVTFSANSLRQVADSNSYDHVRMKKTKDGKYDHVEHQNQINSVNDIDTYDQENALPLDNTYYDTFQLK